MTGLGFYLAALGILLYIVRGTEHFDAVLKWATFPIWYPALKVYRLAQRMRNERLHHTM